MSTLSLLADSAFVMIPELERFMITVVFAREKNTISAAPSSLIRKHK